MNKNNIVFIIIISLVIAVTNLTAEDVKPQENIGYKSYVSKAPVYFYASSFDSKNGEIFVDWDDNLYIVNTEGTFTYSPSGVLINHMDERIQIPVKADSSGNIYLLQQNKIKKLSPQKDLIASFSIDDNSKLVNIDDKGNYYFVSLRKEFKTNDYNEEITKIDDEIKELSKPVEMPDNGEIASIEQRLLDYRNEKRDSTWALEEVKLEYTNDWKEYEFETTAKGKADMKIKVDIALGKIKKYQDRLQYIDKDVDVMNDRIKMINSDSANRIKEKQKENREEIKRLTDEKEKISKQIEEDKKLKYEIRVYTGDKYLTSNNPIPLTQEGIPLYLCQVIVSDRSGNYYGTDGKNVYIYDWDGLLQASFGNNGEHSSGIKAASQLAVDSKGNIYVSDSVKNKILKYGLSQPVLNTIH